MILKTGPNQKMAGVEKVIWEHSRRNFSLQEEGLLSIICPVADGSDIAGVGVFNAGVEVTRELMEEDPAVMAGVFIYEIHASKSFPGDCLPK